MDEKEKPGALNSGSACGFPDRTAGYSAFAGIGGSEPMSRGRPGFAALVAGAAGTAVTAGFAAGALGFSATTGLVGGTFGIGGTATGGVVTLIGLRPEGAAG